MRIQRYVAPALVRFHPLLLQPGPTNVPTNRDPGLGVPAAGRGVFFQNFIVQSHCTFYIILYQFQVYSTVAR